MFKLFREKISRAISRFTGKAKEVEDTSKETEEQIKQESEKPKQLEKEQKKEKEIEKQSQLEKKSNKKEDKKFEEKIDKKPELKNEANSVKIDDDSEKILGNEKEIKPEQKIIEKIEKEEPSEKEKNDGKHEEKKKGWSLFWKKPEPDHVKIKIDEQKFEDLFFELEMTLIENNVAMEVIKLIKTNLHDKLIIEGVAKGKFEDAVKNVLKSSIEKILDFNIPDIIEISKTKKPLKLLFIGINGSGKTTTIAKICNLFQKNGKTCVLVAADTFRAAAIQQLEEHAKRLNAKLIKQDYGSDPAAVAFDAVKYAEAHDIDVVLVDTAGRLHTNTNLIEELRKIKRVIKPDMTIYVGESITGNDCVEQARRYNLEIGIDGIILTKTDVDEKGGAALSVSFVTEKPILFLANGQEYNNIEKFEKEKILNSLGL